MPSDVNSVSKNNMDFPDPKALKKLADACRKAGIKSFKGYGLEFTLDDRQPEHRSSKAKHNHGEQGDIESTSLSPEELMFWSTGISIEGDAVKGDST